MGKRHHNSDALNSVMGKIISVATHLKKKNILLNAERIVPKKGDPEIVVFHNKNEISRFSEKHADVPFDEIKKLILNNLGTLE